MGKGLIVKFVGVALALIRISCAYQCASRAAAN